MALTVNEQLAQYVEKMKSLGGIWFLNITRKSGDVYLSKQTSIFTSAELDLAVEIVKLKGLLGLKVASKTEDTDNVDMRFGIACDRDDICTKIAFYQLDSKIGSKKDSGGLRTLHFYVNGRQGYQDRETSLTSSWRPSSYQIKSRSINNKPEVIHHPEGRFTFQPGGKSVVMCKHNFNDKIIELNFTGRFEHTD